MKAPTSTGQLGLELNSVPAPATTTAAPSDALDVATVHARHAGFVWATLQRLGVGPSDLADVFQNVFVVVHRRLGDYDPARPMPAWLFGICVRAAAAYRRRAHRRHERPVDTLPETEPSCGPDDNPDSPEAAATARQARERLRTVLDLMDLVKRAVFVMYEIDEMSCEEIAAALAVPLGTVYSRLHAARRDFQRILAELDARDEAASGGPR